MEKVPRRGHFNDLSNEYKIISVPRRISSQGFLMVNVHNSKTRTLQNKGSILSGAPGTLKEYSTWFGDDVIRLAPAAGWPNRCATSMQLTI